MVVPSMCWVQLHVRSPLRETLLFDVVGDRTITGPSQNWKFQNPNDIGTKRALYPDRQHKLTLSLMCLGALAMIVFIALAPLRYESQRRLSYPHHCLYIPVSCTISIQCWCYSLTPHSCFERDQIAGEMSPQSRVSSRYHRHLDTLKKKDSACMGSPGETNIGRSYVVSRGMVYCPEFP